MHSKRLTSPKLPAVVDQLDAEIHGMFDQWRRHLTHCRELVDPVDQRGDHLRGDPDAAVTVVEYGCLTSRGESEDDIALRVRLQDRIEAGRVRVVFRHFPLIRAHAGALFAARAVEAAARQNGFWELCDAITDTLAPTRGPAAHGATSVGREAVSALKRMVGPERLEQRPPDIRFELQPASILYVAQRAGLDTARLKSDLTRPDVAAKILRDVDTGIRSGVNGAPTFYVQGVRQDVQGAAELDERIESALIGDLAALWPTSHDHASSGNGLEPDGELPPILGGPREHRAPAAAHPHSERVPGT
jgi:hypothetical protein